MLILPLVSLTIFTQALAVKIDNSVVGAPMVQCEMDRIRLSVPTENEFLGRLFVKGMSKTKGCYRDFSNSTQPYTATLAEIELSLASCGMTRERKLSPRPGLEQSITVVVSFHYLFVTKVDKAYSIQCFYGQKMAATYTNSLDVSMIPSEKVTIGEDSMVPDCVYEVRRGNRDGPIAIYAEVGETLYHRWMCTGGDGMRILVKDCTVRDNNGDQFSIIDDRGCAVDPVVIGDLTYSGNEAYVESHAFKFADTSYLGFACTIQVCSMMMSDDCSTLSPPACSVEGQPPGIIRSRQRTLQRTQRRYKDDPLPILNDEVDVSAKSMNILESSLSYDRPQPLVSTDSENADAPDSTADDLARRLERYLQGAVVGPRTRVSSRDVCMNRFNFGTCVFVACALILGLGGLALSLYLNMARTRHQWKDDQL